MTNWLSNLKLLLLIESTLSVRFFFALASLGYGIDIWNDKTGDQAYHLLYNLAPYWTTAETFWGGLFVFYAFMLLKGLTGQYGFWHLILEAILGWSIWTATAIVNITVTGYPEATVGGAIIATWLLVRYPTHWKPLND